MLRSFASSSFAVALLSAVPSFADEQAGPPVDISTRAPSTDGVAERLARGTAPRALVLPARTAVGSEIDSAAIDVLINSSLEDLGIDAIDGRRPQERCAAHAADLAEAKQRYLDLDLAGALTLAERTRDEEIAAFGDLLGCTELVETELLVVKILADLGRRDEARFAAEKILARKPGFSLDPAKYTPLVQAIWAAALERRSGVSPEVPDTSRLFALGRAVRVDWIAVGIGSSRPKGSEGESLRIVLVPTMEGASPVERSVALGASDKWASAVRRTLTEVFPESPAEAFSASGLAAVDPEGVDDKPPWYKSWWFWTVVGVVVVGGTAGAVGGYYANQEEPSPDVTMSPGSDSGW